MREISIKNVKCTVYSTVFNDTLSGELTNNRQGFQFEVTSIENDKTQGGVQFSGLLGPAVKVLAIPSISHLPHFSEVHCKNEINNL